MCARPSGRHANLLAVSTADTTPSAQALQLRIQRMMSQERRMLLAYEMSLFTRELVKEGVRREHPDWSDTRVARELVRLAFSPQPTPAPVR